MASTLHTFCFASHLVLLHFLGSAVSDVPQKALLWTSWTCSGQLQLRSREEAEDHQGASAVGSSGGAGKGSTQHRWWVGRKNNVFSLYEPPLPCNHTGLCVQRCRRALLLQSPPLMWPLWSRHVSPTSTSSPDLDFFCFPFLSLFPSLSLPFLTPWLLFMFSTSSSNWQHGLWRWSTSWGAHRFCSMFSGLGNGW